MHVKLALQEMVRHVTTSMNVLQIPTTVFPVNLTAPTPMVVLLAPVKPVIPATESRKAKVVPDAQMLMNVPRVAMTAMIMQAVQMTLEVSHVPVPMDSLVQDRSVPILTNVLILPIITALQLLYV